METKLYPPKVDVMPSRRFAGPAERYTLQTRSGIPAQWLAYNGAYQRVSGAVPGEYYGICYGFAADMGSFDYMCGQEVPAGAALPEGFSTVTIAGTYARFATKGHISTMQAVWGEVYGVWLARPEFRPRPGPSVEYYPPEFEGKTGDGGFEIWVAVAE